MEDFMGGGETKVKREFLFNTEGKIHNYTKIFYVDVLIYAFGFISTVTLMMWLIISCFCGLISVVAIISLFFDKPMIEELPTLWGWVGYILLLGPGYAVAGSELYSHYIKLKENYSKLKTDYDRQD